MARWALPRSRNGTPPALARARETVRAGADGALDVLHPLLVLARGLARLVSWAREWWRRTPRDRRGALLFLVVAGLLMLSLMPYGLALGLVALLGASAWQGRERGAPAEGPSSDEEQQARLQSLYEALVPYFAVPDDPLPEPLYAPDGCAERVVEEYGFGEDGRPNHLVLRYPASFPDGEAGERLRVERLLAVKCGRGREYRFHWDEECNLLEVTAPGPLPAGVRAQRFVTGPGEIVLGFTDADAVGRTVPVTVDDAAEPADLPPVVWRTGPRSPEPHLLALGGPGAGTSTLLRSVTLQGLRHGCAVVVDGGGAGEFACLAEREGVLAVESSLTGATALLEWVVSETERRLVTAARSRRAGQTVPNDVRHPLWVVVDRPSVLSHLARAEGRRDPQSLLQVPLRHGRAAGVTVLVAEQLDGADELDGAVRSYPRTRVVLGPVSPQETCAVLGEAPSSAPPPQVPPGRGFARLGGGPVLRLQVPHTPDPYDEAADEPAREAVLALLPPRWAAGTAPAGAGGDEVTGEPEPLQAT